MNIDSIIFQSTRPVRGGTLLTEYNTLTGLFQSTRPVRGGTYIADRLLTDLRFQSTRPVRGGTSSATAHTSPILYFNPPAPCGAGRRWRGRRPIPSRFQSTRPVRGGTLLDRPHEFAYNISIHPPRAGRDGFSKFPIHQSAYFNPPAPCGAGLLQPGPRSIPPHFNPPAPCGAGPRRGSYSVSGLDNFNPPAPCGAGLFCFYS